jgi:hypothetical protein
MAHDVFISHANTNKAVADAACAALEQAGIRCWIAPRDIEPGSDWGSGIIGGIKGSRVMLLVLSAAANRSPQILREVERAVHLGVTIIPLRVEDVMPEGALEFHLGTVHWLDAMTPPLESHLDRVVRTVRSLLDEPSGPAAVGHPMALPEVGTPAYYGIINERLAESGYMVDSEKRVFRLHGDTWSEIGTLEGWFRWGETLGFALLLLVAISAVFGLLLWLFDMEVDQAPAVMQFAVGIVPLAILGIALREKQKEYKEFETEYSKAFSEIYGPRPDRHAPSVTAAGEM